MEPAGGGGGEEEEERGVWLEVNVVLRQGVYGGWTMILTKIMAPSLVGEKFAPCRNVVSKNTCPDL